MREFDPNTERRRNRPGIHSPSARARATLVDEGEFRDQTKRRVRR